MNKILFIHYHYPPTHNSGVYRNYFMSHAIADQLKDEVFVLTTDNVKLFAQDPLPIANNVKIENIFTIDYRTIIAKIFSKKTGGGSQLKEKNKQSHLMQFMIKLQRSFPFNIVLAEGSILYILNGYRKASNLIRENKITTVYTSFMPYADHVIGWMVKKKFPELIWVADFRDLHIEPIYKNTLWPNFQRKFERRILSKADVVTSVSNGLSDKLRDYHSNVVTITKGVQIRPEQTLYDRFTISYVGSLFGDYRDPKPLFKAIKRLLELQGNKIVFQYAGKDGGKMRNWVKECGIEEIYVDLGFVSREQASLIQDRSHINLLLTSSSDDHKGVLTGKLFDYIESRRPILCLVNGVDDDEVNNIFKNYNLGRVFYSNQKEEIYPYLKSIHQEWESTAAVTSTIDIDEVSKNLSWRGQAEKLLNLI